MTDVGRHTRLSSFARQDNGDAEKHSGSESEEELHVMEGDLADRQTNSTVIKKKTKKQNRAEEMEIEGASVQKKRRNWGSEGDTEIEVSSAAKKVKDPLLGAWGGGFIASDSVG